VRSSRSQQWFVNHQAWKKGCRKIIILAAFSMIILLGGCTSSPSDGKSDQIITKEPVLSFLNMPTYMAFYEDESLEIEICFLTNIEDVEKEILEISVTTDIEVLTTEDSWIGQIMYYEQQDTAFAVYRVIIYAGMPAAGHHNITELFFTYMGKSYSIPINSYEIEVLRTESRDDDIVIGTHTILSGGLERYIAEMRNKGSDMTVVGLECGLLNDILSVSIKTASDFHTPDTTDNPTLLQDEKRAVWFMFDSVNSDLYGMIMKPQMSYKRNGELCKRALGTEIFLRPFSDEELQSLIESNVIVTGEGGGILPPSPTPFDLFNPSWSMSKPNWTPSGKAGIERCSAT